MSQQLAYVIITPYSLYKSRTGILSRLISRTGWTWLAMRMFAAKFRSRGTNAQKPLFPRTIRRAGKFKSCFVNTFSIIFHPIQKLAGVDAY